jgi:hypothetical protein
MDAKLGEEIARGLLTFSIDGQVRVVPELKWRENRAWQLLVEAGIARLAGVSLDTPEGQRATSDYQFEAILAYDKTAVLGGREWLEEHATETDLDALYDRFLGTAYPKAESPAAVMAAVLAGALSILPSFKSSRSRTGASARLTSKLSSLIARFFSSTRRHRNA